MKTGQFAARFIHAGAHSRVRHLLPYILCGSFLLLVVGLAISSPFSFVDDHGIVSYLMLPNDLAQQIEGDMSGSGRFRPLYWAVRYTEIRVFGANPLAWHLLTFGMGVLTLSMIYKLLRRTVSLAYAAFGVLILFLYPNSSAIWYRLGVQEGIGTLLLVGGVTALAARRDWLFVLLILLAACVKESFAALVPALLVLYCSIRRQLIMPQSFALGVFGALLLLLLLVSKLGAPDLYAATITGSVGKGTIDSLLLLILPVAGLTSLILALPLTRPGERIAGGAVVALWLLSQAVVYSSLLFERYYFPGILLPALLVPVALYRLRTRRFLFGMALALLIAASPFMANGLLRQVTGVQEYIEANVDFQTQVQEILSWYGYRGTVDFGCTGELGC